MQMLAEFPQVTWICVVLSAAGGAIEVLATALLAYKDAVERETGAAWSGAASAAAVAGNVFLQVASSVLGNLVATWFGPVSLVGAIFLCAQLVANMIVFGSILGLESFSKDMRVGTFVVVIGCVLLPIVGPTSQENQDAAVLLLEKTLPIIWSTVLVTGMLASAVMLLVLDVSKLGSEFWKMGILLTARATSFAVNLTVSKVMVLEVSPWMLLASIVLKVVSGLVITYALIVQASAVSQRKFVPLNASALIIVNAVTGMIVWQDYDAVQDWVGYACVFIQLILGNYLLLGGEDAPMLLSPENQKYGRAKALEEMASIVSIAVPCHVGGDHHTLGSELTEDGYEKRTGFEYFDEGGAKLGEVRHQAAVAGAAHRRRLSTREAWSSVYGIDPHGEHRRTKSILFIDDDAVAEGDGAMTDDSERRGTV